MSCKKYTQMLSSGIALSAFLALANVPGVSADELTNTVDSTVGTTNEVPVEVNNDDLEVVQDSVETSNLTPTQLDLEPVIDEADLAVDPILESEVTDPITDEAIVLAPEVTTAATEELVDTDIETSQSADESPLEPIVMATQAEVKSELDAFLEEPNEAKLIQPEVTDGERIAGQSRDHLSAEISQRGWESSDLVIITNGFSEADSLTGSALASSYDAPIIFTRNNVLPEVSKNEIKRLGASRALILGGKDSVSDAILQELESQGLQTERLNGSNRYELAANIADKVVDENPKNTHAFLVNGDAFADAISIAPVSAREGSPILLTRADTLHKDVINFMPRVKTWTIIGGFNSISQAVENQLKEHGGQVIERISGDNRYEVNRKVLDRYEYQNDYVLVASGERIADALTASVLAAQENTGILLIKNDNAGTIKEQKTYIDQKGYGKTIFVGGPTTISEATVQALATKETNSIEKLAPEVDAVEEAPVQETKKQGPIVRNVSYRVKSGDTLYALADSFGTTAEAIAAASGFASIHTPLSLDKVLTIPSAEVQPMKRAQSKDNKHTVYLDAGHGGWDAGAVYSGVYEKTLNLNMAQKLNQRLRNLGYIVVMNRTDDQGMGLVTRANDANSSTSDIFVSIHHNAANSYASGIETFYYLNSNNYKTDNNNIYHNDVDRITNSAYLAGLVQNQLIKNTGAYNRGVKSDTLSVLRNTAMPAILLELGFGDNPAELANLKNNTYQNKMADALTSAIDTYFKTVPW